MSDLKQLEQAFEALPTGALGIKETMDLINLLSGAVDAFVAAKADGKIDIDDFQHLVGVMTSAVEAYKGSEQIVAELKDLDSAEAGQLFTAVFMVVQKLISALGAKEVAVPVVMPIG